MIAAKRAYEPAEPSDGYRVLIDRLWPRGVSKAKARLNALEKSIAPSGELREWYGHDPAKWPEFRKRYTKELRATKAKRGSRGSSSARSAWGVTLVYGSRAAEIRDVAVLEAKLKKRVLTARRKR